MCMCVYVCVCACECVCVCVTSLCPHPMLPNSHDACHAHVCRGTQAPRLRSDPFPCPNMYSCGGRQTHEHISISFLFRLPLSPFPTSLLSCACPIFSHVHITILCFYPLPTHNPSSYNLHPKRESRCGHCHCTLVSLGCDRMTASICGSAFFSRGFPCSGRRWLLHCCCTVVTLLLHCFYTVVTLLSTGFSCQGDGGWEATDAQQNEPRCKRHIIFHGT
jgi:hypothetical protein